MPNLTCSFPSQPPAFEAQASQSLLSPILKLASGLVIALIASFGTVGNAQAAVVIGGPTNRAFNIGGLRDGNYRFCSNQPEAASTSDEVVQTTGACFRFNKQANNIIGNYYYPSTGSSICFRGRVRGNTLTGQAIERLKDTMAPTVEFSRGELVSWKDGGFLQVGEGIYVDDLNRRDAIRYRSALLNMNNFYQYNAGRVSPPSDCPTRPSSTISVQPTLESLEEIGTSRYFNQPVYLDTSSIEAIEEGSTYTYTTLVGVPSRLSETEYRVDCSASETVQVLRSRYYDTDGDLQELEVVNKSVAATQENAATTQRYNASRYVCGEYAQTTEEITIPENTGYQRYRNERYDYSLLYPDDILMPRADVANEAGQAFVSEDEAIVLKVYGAEKSDVETLAARYEQAQQKGNITYRTMEDDDFFVVSGTSGDNIIYQKTLLEDGIFKVLELTYPQSLRREFDENARVIADSFSSLEVGTGLSQLPAEVQTAVLEAASFNTEAPSAIFQVVDVERQVWPGGCLGLPKPDEACTKNLVPGWQVKVEAEVAGGMREFTYRTDETGSEVRLERL